ncbi:hypothetical protein PR003_g13924 [Phytophthora rubi]|uniref:Thioredoxin domain-containing protein n=1 Tax=Phytophthora rubi TaxID=129364 RepID=A0A6A4FFR2_9STRA|nr:hypothetical protein PR001_g4844 [Phytophthora rubi]KAE9333636.1 hypothetical protein PR003_g13924 [Phytophthora rubi]
MASSSNIRRHRGSHGGVGLWLRRNVWLVAAATFVVLYCAFMVRTTMWARALGVEQEQQAMSDHEAMATLKEMGVIRGENAREEAEEQAEEAAEHGREQLVKGEGDQEAVGEEEAHNVHADATAGPQLRTEEQEDTVASDDKVPLEDAGDIPMVGATSDSDVEASTSAVPTATEETKTHNWTAFYDLPVAGGATSGKGGVAKETESPENKGPELLTPLVVASDNDAEHLWTGVDNLPVAGEDTTQQDAPAFATAITTVDGSGESQNLTVSAQIQPPVTLTSRKFDTSRLVLETPEQANASISFEKRHHTIFGYNATMTYLQLYAKSPDSQEQLFLFFTCSDSKGNRDDWTPNCATAREKVYATFAKSPSTNRLVTIHTGPREDWTGGNAFTDDVDLRLKAIPTVMRWDGGVPGSLRSTWGVLVDHSIMYEPLLRYLFRNADEQDNLLAKPEVETKEIITLRGYAQYRAYMETYAQNGTPYPLFMMMVSGRFQHNNRLWCPWCRQSEMPVEYAFYAYAPAKTKLVLVETYDKYSEWRNPENDFKQDPQLAMKGVPWFYRVLPGPPGQPLTYQRVKKKFYLLEALQQAFEGSE